MLWIVALFSFPACLGVVTDFTTLPASRTIVEGQDVLFSCAVNDGSDPIHVNWRVNSVLVAGNRSLEGSGGAFLSDGGSPLTLKSVSRTLDSISVLCTARISRAERIDQTNPPATLTVNYPPKLDVNSDLKALTVGESFIMDCSPVEAKPPANAITFLFNSLKVDQNDPSMTVNNYVLIISNIQRRHRGTYSCEVSNGFGNAATAAVPVNVLGPPTVPRGLRIVDLQPFSAQVTWSPPEDNGGVEPVQYRGTVSNGTVLDFNTTDFTILIMSHLQHSTSYTLSVFCENIYGSSPTVEFVFRTDDSVPIIDVVQPKPLSSVSITVTITLLTTGGRDVTGFNIVADVTSSVDRTFVADGKLVVVTIVVNGLNLTEGKDHKVSVTATNSIGTSEPVNGILSLAGPVPSSTSLNTVAIAVSVVIGILVAILLALIIINGSIFLYMKHRKTASMNLQTRAAVTSSRETVENIYAGVGTNSDTATQNVQLESNPAYQPATSDTSVHRPNQYEEVETQDDEVSNPAQTSSSKGNSARETEENVYVVGRTHPNTVPNPAYRPTTTEASAQDPNYEEIETRSTNDDPIYEPIGLPETVDDPTMN